MKWSYTNGKLNVSSDEADQQFLLKELIEEASRHQAYQKKIISLFVVLSLLLFFMQSYGGELPTNASNYFYIGYFATPLIISGLISFVTYVLMRKPPIQVRKLNKYFQVDIKKMNVHDELKRIVKYCKDNNKTFSSRKIAAEINKLCKICKSTANVNVSTVRKISLHFYFFSSNDL